MYIAIRISHTDSKGVTSNMICIVGLGVGFKCARKIHLNTQWPYLMSLVNFSTVQK